LLKRRLFVAAEVDDVTHAACARVAEQLRAKGWPGRMGRAGKPPPHRCVLGYVGEEHITAVAAAVREIAPRIPALDVPLDTVGAFPNQRRPAPRGSARARRFPRSARYAASSAVS
jgi:2'-5' RNA ligase